MGFGSHSVTCYPTQVNEQPDMLVLDLPTPEEWIAELILVLVIYRNHLLCSQTVAHPGSNHLIATGAGVKPATA